MASTAATSGRSVKIAADERTGWSSDRPRPDGAPARPANLTVHCSVLRPADRLRYSPGSLLVVVSASAAERDSFLERADRGPLVAALARQGPRPARRTRRRRGARGARRTSCSRRPSRSGWRTGRPSCLAPTPSKPEEREPFVRIASQLETPAPPDPARDRARSGPRGGPRDPQRPAPGARRRRARRGGLPDRPASRRRHGRGGQADPVSAPAPRRLGHCGLVLAFDPALGRVGVIEVAEQRGIARGARIRSSGEPSGSSRPWRVPK